MIRLYYAAQTRSVWIRMLLEELGAPYELIRLDPRTDDRVKQNYFAIHPLGSFPAIVDEGTAIYESAAIVAYLTEKFPEKNLAPAQGSPARGVFFQWLVYPVATLEPIIRSAIRAKHSIPDPLQAQAALQKAQNEFEKCIVPVRKRLESSPFIMGSEFSAADIMVAIGVSFGQWIGLVPADGVLSSYINRVKARPAYTRASAD